MRFANLLKRDGDSPAALAEAIKRTEGAGAEAVSRLAELGKQRRAALIGDDDTTLDRIEAEITKATRDRDRAVEARLELLDRLQAAQQAERQARLDAIHTAGMGAQEKATALIRGRYRKLAAEMANLARELQQFDAEIFDANRRLQAEGDPRVITPGDEVARPQRGGTIPLLPTAIPAGLRLPHPEDGTRYLWPSDADVTNAGSHRPQVLAIPPREAA